MRVLIFCLVQRREKTNSLTEIRTQNLGIYEIPTLFRQYLGDFVEV